MFMKKAWLVVVTRVLVLLVGGLACVACTAQGADRVVAWGDINYDVTMSPPPPGGGILRIAAGDFHSLALNSGAIVAWGDDRFNQTNLPDALRSAPASGIAAGNVHNLALMQDRTVIAWGPAPGQSGDYGQCTVPAGLADVIAVAAGAAHSLALKSDGTVMA
jgi:alpha-tubulin suppressor-like RCC1 family protein